MPTRTTITTQTTQEGDFLLMARIDAREIEHVTQAVLTQHLHDFAEKVVEALRDKVVETLEPQVIAKVDVQAVANMATMRAGVAIAERAAAAVVPERKQGDGRTP